MGSKVYKGDVLAQVWIESRVLATLSIYLDTEGVMTRFLSEVVRETLEMVVANLVRDGKVEMVEFTEDARRMLQTRYRINLNPGLEDGKCIGGRNLQHNLEMDSRRREVGDGYNIESRFIQSMPRAGTVQGDHIENKIDDFDMDEAVRIMDDLKYKEVKKSAEEEKKKVLANADIDENGVITPRGTPKGIVGEEEFKAYKERERLREREEELEKRDRRLEKREEKLLNELDDLRTEEKDGTEQE